MAPTVSTLCAILQRPDIAAEMAPRDWTGLVVLARKANLLGALAERLAEAEVSTGCNADRHLGGARQLSERQRRSVRWEAQAIHDALCELAIPVVLLKGAAYVMGGHATALGRLFGDIDILVPTEHLGDVEIRLMVNGWSPAVSVEYDERYYRRWMHELPPMAHLRRGTVIDVHHTILPPTARLTPNPAGIIERAQAVTGLPALRVPAAEDLVVHSIVHLVHEGSVDNALRDLYDVLQLLESGAADPGFASRLQEVCWNHGVAAPVAMGIRLLERFFTPSAKNLPTIRCQASGPNFGYGPAAEWLYYRAIESLGHDDSSATLLRLAIYVRAHWLRMPPQLLMRHLAKKLFLRIVARVDDPAGAVNP